MEEQKKVYKILIIDDDKFLLDMYAMKFKKNGMDVNTAVNGNDAIEKIKSGFMPDIMLIDVVMPGMDGHEFVAKAKADNLAPNSIMIMLTNQSVQADIDKAKAAGVHGYIVKATSIPSEVVEEALKIARENGK